MSKGISNLSAAQLLRARIDYINNHGIKKLAPGVNPEFAAYERKEAKKKSEDRSMSKAQTGRSSRSKWFVRGAGTI